MMVPISDGTHFSPGGISSRAGQAVFTTVLVLLVAVPCLGQTPPESNLPKVLMLASPRSNSSGASLFKAIRAQLSASPLILGHIALTSETSMARDPLGNAADLARRYHAAMVFWIETEDPCTMHFYIPDSSGGHINSRAIEIDLNSQSSRFEVIAVVASGMIEGLLKSYHLNASVSPPPKQPQPPDTAEKRRKRLEIFAAYSGSLVATDLMGHGGTVGAGFLPIDRLVIAAAFTQNAPYRFANSELRLEVTSRQIELFAAGSVWTDPIDFRLGLAWSVDLRSYSTSPSVAQIEALRDGFIAVHSLVPFLLLAWTYHDRIGLFARLNAHLALNETKYRILRADGPSVAFKPFVAKLSYQIGMLIRF